MKLNLGRNKEARWDHIISMVWLYIMLFPTGTAFNVSILILLLFLYDRNLSNNNKVVRLLLLLLIPTALLNFGQPYMDFKPLVRLVAYVVIFLTFASYRGNKILFPYALIAVCYILLSQVSIVLNLPYLASFFDNTYGITETLQEKNINLSKVEMVSAGISSRLGGLYVNSNNCASYLSLIYAVGLCAGKQLGEKKQVILYLFIVLIAVSMLITGSRTSLIVFISISLYYLYAKGYSIQKYLVIGVIIVLVIMSLDIEELRIFKVKDGMHDSFGEKNDLFVKYLSKCTNPIWWLFGAGDVEVTVSVFRSNMPGTDHDFGNIFITFGLFFYIAYILFIIKMWRMLKKEYRVILFVLLWSFSNTILVNYRMCPAYFMALAYFYKDSLSSKYSMLHLKNN